MHANVQPALAQRTRLSPQRLAELYAVVIELLREVGYESLTMPDVAVRARCSTATLYRQWQGKPGLVVAALRHHQPPPGPELDVDTGSLRGDLHEVAARVPIVTPQEHQLMAALAHATLRDPELAAIVHQQLAEPAALIIDRVIQRAIDRGEIPADTPARAFAPYLMIAMAQARPMLDGQYADAEYMVRYVDAVMIPALKSPAHPGSQQG